MPLELDYGDYAPYRPLPSMHNTWKQYKIEIELWPKDDPTATQYYWHLYFKGEHVNGGLCDNEDQAHIVAAQYKNTHQRQEFLATYIWDEESYRWQRRDYFMR